MSKAVSNAYMVTRFMQAAMATFKAAKDNQRLGLVDVGRIFVKEIKAPLTSAYFDVPFSKYIAPRHSSTDEEALKEDFTKGASATVVVRKTPIPSRMVRVGDVVAWRQAQSEDESFVVRRVAALEGDEMISSSPEDEPFELPEGTVWLLGDNEALTPQECEDSRTVGPVSHSEIVGRCVYFCTSPTDHGIIENSEESMEIDELIVEAEVDPQELLKKL